MVLLQIVTVMTAPGWVITNLLSAVRKCSGKSIFVIGVLRSTYGCECQMSTLSCVCNCSKSKVIGEIKKCCRVMFSIWHGILCVRCFDYFLIVYDSCLPFKHHSGSCHFKVTCICVNVSHAVLCVIEWCPLALASHRWFWLGSAEYRATGNWNCVWLLRVVCGLENSEGAWEHQGFQEGVVFLACLFGSPPWR